METKNPCWKGNRTFNFVCRSRLYAVWTYPILKRDGFKCVMCKNNTELHVHHIVPLRDIIDETLCEFNIKNVYGISNELYDTLINKVISKHSTDNGLTVCKMCHSKIDKFYKAKV